MSQPSRLDLLQGTLDLLILRTLETGPRHGWAISERIQQISRDVLRVNQGRIPLAPTRAVQPQLYGLEAHGPFSLLAAAAGVTAVAMLAAFFPARRAMRIEPVRALRYE